MAWDARVPTIVIGLPHYDKIDMEFVERTWGPLKWQGLDWCTKIPYTTRTPSLAVARNEVVYKAIEHNADYVFFIDGDILFEGMNPNDALKTLFNVNKPIVSGWYKTKQREGFKNAMWVRGDDKYVHVEKWDESKPHAVLQVDLVGAGCLLVKTEIFKRLPEPWFFWDYRKQHSEDFNFCIKAQSLGQDYYPYVCTDVKLSHIGTLVIENNGNIRTVNI